MTKPFRSPCHCSAYPFPHRLGSGLCPFLTHSEEMCSACGKPAQTQLVDFGVGKGEFWGRPYNDVKLARVTYCCEAPTQPITKPLARPDHPTSHYLPSKET